MSAFRPCVVIPTYNHVHALDAILAHLETCDLPVLVVDDGSAPETGTRIREVCAGHATAEYQRHAFNGGKGFAVMCGLARAQERGFTHVVQIDADGQHDLSGVPDLLTMAQRNPGAIVTGVPEYDDTLPLVRRIWRPFTLFWVRVNTLSTHIKDAMCGFRVYPIEPVLTLVRESVHTRHMEFDIEVLVKAYWAGMAVAPVPVCVSYPEENFSNFALVRDNVRLTLMQTRLFFGMLMRSPSLLMRAPLQISGQGEDAGADPSQASWGRVRERGAYWGMRLLAGIYTVLGRRACLAAMMPAVSYFFVTGGMQRRASQDFLMRAWARGFLPHRPTLWLSFRHFMSFGAAALDKLAAWIGNISAAELPLEQTQLLEQVALDGRGALIITAHFGNPEIIRAIATLDARIPINVLMHAAQAEMFNRLIRAFSPDARVRAVPVEDIGVQTALLLSQAIERGEWIVTAGDRVPLKGGERTVEVPFMGGRARFPQGPYILGALFKAPVYVMSCVRTERGFKVDFSKFADPIKLPRGNREQAIRQYAVRYAEVLEGWVAETPLQWFNFYPFWEAAPGEDASVAVIEGAAQ